MLARAFTREQPRTDARLPGSSPRLHGGAKPARRVHPGARPLLNDARVTRSSNNKTKKETQQVPTQFATRVSDDQAKLFRAYTAELGTTPSDAMRILITAFVQNKGFPCEIRLKTPADSATQQVEIVEGK